MALHSLMVLFHLAACALIAQCMNMRNMTHFIPANYSSDFPPPPSGSDGKQHINISVQFITLMEINELQGTFQYSCFYRVFWDDLRLDPQTTSKHAPLRIPESDAKRLWRPDIITENVRGAMPNGILRPTIYNGRFYGHKIFVSKYLSIRIGCTFEYQGYPLDIQICRLHLTNMGMTTKTIKLSWSHPSFTMNRNEFLGFQDKFQMRLCEDTSAPVRRTKLGEHPQKTLLVIMERHYMTYVVQLFLPSILFILIAWLSILVPPTMLRTRLLLNSTNLLTILFMFLAISRAEATHIPNVSYLTALNLWMFVCVAFVFSSVLIVIFDIRLITILTQRDGKQHRMRKIVINVYKRRQTRCGSQLPDFVQDEDEDNEDAAVYSDAAASKLQSLAASRPDANDLAPNPDPDGDLFMDASSEPVASDEATEQAELERRVRRKRRLWLELAAFYERMYLLAFPALFCLFLLVFFWYYLWRRHVRLNELLPIVRGSGVPNPGCWCTDQDRWAGCMTHAEYAALHK